MYVNVSIYGHETTCWFAPLTRKPQFSRVIHEQSNIKTFYRCRWIDSYFLDKVKGDNLVLGACLDPLILPLFSLFVVFYASCLFVLVFEGESRFRL